MLLVSYFFGLKGKKFNPTILSEKNADVAMRISIL